MNKLNNLNVNYFKIPKKHRRPHKMPSRAVCFRPLSWHSLATTTFFLDIYLLRLKLHCNGLLQIVLSVAVFINDFILTFRREKRIGSSNHNPTCA